MRSVRSLRPWIFRTAIALLIGQTAWLAAAALLARGRLSANAHAAVLQSGATVGALCFVLALAGGGWRRWLVAGLALAVTYFAFSALALLVQTT